jgi:hypothetical protein
MQVDRIVKEEMAFIHCQSPRTEPDRIRKAAAVLKSYGIPLKLKPPKPSSCPFEDLLELELGQRFAGGMKSKIVAHRK